MTTDLMLVGLTVLLLFANAFFVGAEFALISARRTMIEPKALAGSRRARITLDAMERVSLMMAGAQLGITICSLGLGSLGEPAVAHLLEKPFAGLGVPDDLLHPIAFVVAMSIVVFLHVVIGEMVPKNIALAGPDRAALVLGPPLVWVVKVLHPAIWLLNQLANLTLRAFKVQPKDEVTSTFTRDEVAGLVAESRSGGLLDLEDERLLMGALTFEERAARTVLIPVAELKTVEPGASPAQVEQLAVATGFSRFPVRAGDGDLLGYVHLKDLIETDAGRRQAPMSPRVVRALPRVSADDALRAILGTMQRSGAHLAKVVDEGGQTVGVVALEDVLEELVGQIRDDSSGVIG